ncbi:antiviral reverse transcriptase Drt3a [Pseudomonas sp. RL_35y_Pfl2_P42]|uniref:antiviral reverse transcriptase Drt3a n=1 Tax=Pseudomonas sp. RL_35y_Pfl2_P42 TaxID=3088710 RepID=UPI0030D88B14
MIESPFTIRNLARFIARNRNDDSSNTKADYELAASEILKKIDAGTVFHNAIADFPLNKKTVFTYTTEDAKVASKLIIRNLELNARIKQPNRSEIISALLSSLQDGTPYRAHRYDIKSFYESINRAAVLTMLEDESLCSLKTLNLIRILFCALDVKNAKGLPRGLDISAYLSEIYLRHFDAKLRRLEHVNFYARFVDDIIMLTSNDKEEETTNHVKALLSDDLTLHNCGKRSDIQIRKSETINEEHKSKTRERFEILDYLGYEFKIFSTYISNNDFRAKRRVEVEISINKIKKIKSRLFSSLLSYCSSPKKPSDFNLLQKRLKALTGNYEINASGTNVIIKTGIYFNYHHRTPKHNCRLSELDRTFRRALFSRTHPLFNRISASLLPHEKRELSGFSFLKGYENITYYSFSYKELTKIRMHWNK